MKIRKFSSRAVPLLAIISVTAQTIAKRWSGEQRVFYRCRSAYSGQQKIPPIPFRFRAVGFFSPIPFRFRVAEILNDNRSAFEREQQFSPIPFRFTASPFRFTVFGEQIGTGQSLVRNQYQKNDNYSVTVIS